MEARIIGGLAGFVLLMTIVHILGPVWQDFGEFVGLSGILLLSIGLLAGRAIPRKRRFRRVQDLATGLFAVGGGLMFGSLPLLSGRPLFWVVVFVPMIILTVLFTSLMVWVNKTQERMNILVDGDYSLELVRDFVRKISETLVRKDLPHKKYGNDFQLDLERKERINIAVRADPEYEDTKYMLILRTNRSRDAPVYTSLRAGISEIVREIERERGIDSYPKVDRVVCLKCGRKVGFIVASDQFFCNKCRKYKEDKDVNIITV
jgi:hypothetical protein